MWKSYMVAYSEINKLMEVEDNSPIKQRFILEEVIN